MKMRMLRSIQFLLLLLVLAIPATSFAQVSLSITIAPPELVVYTQPVCPQEGYLWTPGYWGWGSGAYAWNQGYWGTEVGFYGGVNYGFGYGGVGYEGGYWRNNQFSYNTYVNVGVGGSFRNTYNKTVVNNTTYVSYNGGTGGITARPTATEETAAHAQRTPPTAAQTTQRTSASQNHELLASVNHGKPPIAATSKPGEFSGTGVVAAKGATAENKAAESKTAETKANENKTSETKATDDKAAETKATENKAAESKATEDKAAETKATENKAAESKATEDKAAETKATENKAAES